MATLTPAATPDTLQPTLSRESYLSSEIFGLEKKWIFAREWMCVARDEELAAGASMVLDVVGESILVARNLEGELRAFYNVCRHRGSELCTPKDNGENRHGVELTGGLTSRGFIRCPYHAWVYNLDGELVATPHVELPVLQRNELSLHPVGVQSWNGFVFVNLTPQDAPLLQERLNVVTDRVRRYALCDLPIGKSIRYIVEANWKVVAENYNECYHCGGVHPELCDVVPAFRKDGGGGLDWGRGVPHREGAVTYSRTGTTTRRPFPALTDDEQVRHKGELIYPNFFLSLSCDHVTAFVLAPKGPALTEITVHFLFEADEVASERFDPADTVEFWDLVNRQDWEICERVQRGMNSRAFSGGFYAPMEDYSLDIRTYFLDKIGPHLNNKIASESLEKK